jgi:hypothetical protein
MSDSVSTNPVPTPCPAIEDGIVEIHDPEIDVQAIMAQIRANLATRGQDDRAIHFPSFGPVAGGAGAVCDGDAGPLNAELYYNLGQLNLDYDQITVESTLETRPMRVVGPLVNRFKAEFHNLCVYYVNLLAGKQVGFNEHATRALNQLARELERKDTEVVALRQELADLRTRLDRAPASERP